MTSPSTPGPDDAQVGERAHLLPEELAAGSDDPLAQAEQILAESAERTEDPEGTQERSVQTAEGDAAPDAG